MPITPINLAKNSITPSSRSKTFNGVYGVARYGISTYGTGTAGAGIFVNLAKNTTTPANLTKN